MTYDQATIAGPLLNSYAHQYLGLPPDRVQVVGARKYDRWFLIVARAGHETTAARGFDEAKQLIDELIR